MWLNLDAIDMLKWLKSFLAKNIKPTGEIIRMWEHNGWGDSVSFWDWEKRRIQGHLTPLPNVGDEVQCKMSSGITGRFLIIELEPCGDPYDMFFGTVKDLPPII